MDKKLREMQERILKVFSRRPGGFALTGGTALELYYLLHRFSGDLDLFSPEYKVSEIERLVSEFKKVAGKIKMEAEFIAPNKAKVRFYSVSFKGFKRMLKIDFVEDALFKKPDIKMIKAVPVYSAENIYFQKITTITGTALVHDDIGREIIQGRREARDVYDIYMLSRKIKPLHIFLSGLPPLFQRGVVHWYRTFSRQDVKLGLLDLDIYDKNFDSRKMISYLEDEIKKFMELVLQ